MFALLLALFTSSSAFAYTNYPGGVSFDVAVGSGQASIQNPDDSKAYYKILSIEGRAAVPVYESETYAINLLAGLRYLDLSNTANNSAQSEVANLIGPEVGLAMRLLKIDLGLSYQMMQGRHYTVGAISNTINYHANFLSWQVGYLIPLGKLTIGFNYSRSAGKIPASASGLSRDSPFNDQIYWIRAIYSTGLGFKGLMDALF